MSEPEHRSSIDGVQPSGSSMKIMVVMLAAVTVAVAAVLGLVRGSEALMLAITLPAAAIAGIVVLIFVLRLAGEGSEPDPDPTN